MMYVTIYLASDNMLFPMHSFYVIYSDKYENMRRFKLRQCADVKGLGQKYKIFCIVLSKLFCEISKVADPHPTNGYIALPYISKLPVSLFFFKSKKKLHRVSYVLLCKCNLNLNLLENNDKSSQAGRHGGSSLILGKLYRIK